MKARDSIMYSIMIFVCVLISLMPHRVDAQTQKRQVETLAKGAEMIVVGKVAQVRSEWNKERTRIFTKVSLNVEEYVKGESSLRTLAITHPGGEIGAVGELYTHTPTFSQGEEVLVFLKKDGRNNLVVTGGNEGKLTITKNQLTGERIMMDGETLKTFTSRVKSLAIPPDVK